MAILFNLLPYRPTTTGLSLYVHRLLSAWPISPPTHLSLSSSGTPCISLNPFLPQVQTSTWFRFLQDQSLVQHSVSLRSLFGFQPPDLVYSPYPDYLFQLRGVPQVITCHDLIPLYYPNSQRAYLRSRFYLSRHFRRSDWVIAISRTVADQLISTGIHPNRIEVIPNGVPSASDPISGPSSFDCLLVSRHSIHKNISYALLAFAHLLRLEPGWPGNLVVVGSQGRCTAGLLRLERQLGLLGRIRWLSYLTDEDLSHLYRTSLCLVSPSLMEGFDYPLAEAQAHGLPTLASNIPVHREFHQVTSLLFELDDQGVTMAHQIQSIGRDPALWRHLSLAGLSNSQSLSLHRQARDIHDMLNQCLR